MKYQNVLFDLDGTLTDPAEGITNSVAYALKKYGICVDNRETLYPFIGPPLKESFMKYFGFSDLEALHAVEFYREYFSDRGIFENKLYPGTREMLEYLHKSGRRIILATSKPSVFAGQILEHFKIEGYFSFISGSELDGRRTDKKDVIAHAVKSAEISPESSLMVGDRIFDAAGAGEFGMDFAAALYGYGNENEFSSADVMYKVWSCDDLTEFFRNWDK